MILTHWRTVMQITYCRYIIESNADGTFNVYELNGDFIDGGFESEDDAKKAIDQFDNPMESSDD